MTNFLTANIAGLDSLQPNDSVLGYQYNRVVAVLSGLNPLPISTGPITIIGGGLTMTGPLVITGNPGSILMQGIGTATIVGGTTGLSLMNNANNATNLGITDVGAVTVRNALTVSAGDITATSGNLRLDVASAGIYMNAGGGVAAIIAPTGGFNFYNNAVNAVNLSISDLGLVTTRSTLTVSAGGFAVTGSSSIVSNGGNTVLTMDNTASGTTTFKLNVFSSGVYVGSTTSTPISLVTNGSPRVTVGATGGLTLLAGNGLTITDTGLTVSAGGATITGGMGLGTANAAGKVLNIGYDHALSDALRFVDVNAAPFTTWLVGPGTGGGPDSFNFYNGAVRMALSGLGTGLTIADGLTVTAGGILSQVGVASLPGLSLGAASLGVNNPRLTFYDDVTNASYTSYDAGTVTYFRATGGNFKFQTVPTGATRFSAAGTDLVVIGSGTPTLTVGNGITISAGGLNVTGTTTLGGLTYTWPGAQSASQVLQTNGSGVLSWQSIVSGVSSVTGTANQVTASPTTGAVIVGLPTSGTLPGSWTAATGFTVTAGGAAVSAGGVSIGTSTGTAVDSALSINSAAANQAYLNILSAGTLKWQIGRQANNDLYFYNVGRSNTELNIVASNGLVSIAAGLSVGTTGNFVSSVTADSFIAAGGVVTIQSGNTGLLYFGNTGINYLQFNGTNFRFSTSPLTLDAGLTATTGTFSSTVSMTGLTATTGSFSSTVSTPTLIITGTTTGQITGPIVTGQTVGPNLWWPYSDGNVYLDPPKAFIVRPVGGAVSYTFDNPNAAFPGALALTGALTGATTGAFSGAVSMAALTATTGNLSGALEVAARIRTTKALQGTPWTDARIMIYGGPGVDTTNWGYLAYGNDASMRFVHGNTTNGAPLIFGTTSATDNTGTFTETARLTNAGVFTAANLAGTLNTAAQPNITSLGTIAGLVTSGTTTFHGIAYTWPATAGTNTYNLTTDGIGTLSWTAAGAAGVTSVIGTANQVTSSPTTGAVIVSLPSSGTLPGAWTVATGFTITAGALTIGAAASKIVPGATSFSHRNNADSADNLLIADAGDLTGRTKLTMPGPLTLSTAISKIVPGATSLSLRNNADNADNLILTDAGAATFRSTVGGITTLTATTLGGTLSTAAQASVTSLGTLTSMTTSGTITMTAAVSKIVPGATSMSLRNNADNADNLIITNAGAATFRSTVGGITTLTATTLGGTLSTAAQASVTSLGTLTSMTTSGAITMTATASQIIPGATSMSLRNNANNADNLILTDAGLSTFRNDLTISAGNIILGGATSRLIPGATNFAINNHANTANNFALDNGGTATFWNAVTITTTDHGSSATSSYGSLPLKYDEQTLSAASSITIPSSGNLPTTFRHMEIVYRLRGNFVGGLIECGTRINGDTASHYQAQRLQGLAGVVTASEQAGALGYAGLWYIGGTTGFVSTGRIFIADFNYSTIKNWRVDWCAYQTNVAPPQAGQLYVGQTTQAWYNNASISSVTLLPLSSTFDGVVTTYLYP